MPWLRLRFASECDPDVLGERLLGAGAVAVTARPGPDADDALEPPPGQVPRWRGGQVEALLPIDADLTALPRLDFEVDFLADREWSCTWRGHFGPMRFGRLVVMPRDCAATELAVDEVALRLDPGLAFGTGTHPSTALCLEWLGRRQLAGRRVLDVGCGSGILAIAARRLGAGPTVAVDHDPQARRATADNAARNRVAVTIASELAAVREMHTRFDIAVANIVANTLCALADDLHACADQVVLSGILPGQAERVMDAFAGFEFQVPVVKDGWALLCGRHA